MTLKEKLRKRLQRLQKRSYEVLHSLHEEDWAGVSTDLSNAKEEIEEAFNCLMHLYNPDE